MKLGLCAIFKKNGLLQGSFLECLIPGYPSIIHSTRLWDGRGVDTFAVSKITGLLGPICVNLSPRARLILSVSLLAGERFFGGGQVCSNASNVSVRGTATDTRCVALLSLPRNVQGLKAAQVTWFPQLLSHPQWSPCCHHLTSDGSSADRRDQ